MIKKYFISGIVFIFIFSSCTYYSEKELYPDEICDTTQVTYVNDILPVFEKECYACHHDGNILYGNLDLANFDHIQNVVDEGDLLRNIKHEPNGIPMPKGGGKLPDCTILKIENWVNQGIPKN